MPSDPVVSALSRIARVVATTLELREVFARVAEAAATVLPFDVIIVERLEGPDTLKLYSFAGGSSQGPDTARLADFSPALRPPSRCAQRIDDLAQVLDPSFPADRAVQEQGWRSSLVAPVLRRKEVAGFVWLGSRRPRAFTADHEAALCPIADLLGLALEHERLWNLDAERRRRLEVLDQLLLTMAPVLDVREIFNQLSAVVQTVLPHDRLALASYSADRRLLTFDALSGEPVPDLPLGFSMDGKQKRAAHDTDEEVIDDVEALPEAAGVPPEAAAAHRRLGRALGTRSLLRISLRLEGGLVGELAFISQTPGRYSQEDIVVARRVADHVSLALSHQRLAEEQRQAAEARERAAQLEERVEALKEELETSRGYRRVLGDSKLWQDVLTLAAKVAPTETTVMLTGESGTGKEVVARFIHRGSPRARGPFVALNCAALPETLLESELFGHEKGAFTGAAATHPGRIEQAAGGVLFLDEVGEMSPAVQAKLLRVLQEREFQRLGGTRPLKANVRVLAATNRDLDVALARGQFREDLYYRLRVFEIRLPPLRERREDIMPMAEAFLEELGPAVGRPAAGISRQAHEALLSYPWPGNVRELRNVLERASILCDGGLITLEHLPVGVGRGQPAGIGALPRAGAGTGTFRELPETGGAPVVPGGGDDASLPAGSFRPGGEPGTSAAFPPGGVNLEMVERDLIAKALQEARNNRSRAARLLGISRSQLYYKLQKHGIEAAVAPAAPRA
ncbi:MAG TPA: sigma 54-interacting transcriptional regulator [Thermoanaerobaculia bacterium]|nr:sigma 54-interacting transcriptional regulator [Thermoanaerobaculia bacterium]